MFIKLTQVMMVAGEQKETTVYVNSDNITYILAFKQSYYLIRSPEDKTSTVNDLRRFHTVTSISFTAGMQEESDSINVLETPETVMVLMGEI